MIKLVKMMIYASLAVFLIAGGSTAMAEEVGLRVIVSGGKILSVSCDGGNGLHGHQGSIASGDNPSWVILEQDGGLYGITCEVSFAQAGSDKFYSSYLIGREYSGFCSMGKIRYEHKMGHKALSINKSEGSINLDCSENGGTITLSFPPKFEFNMPTVN